MTARTEPFISGIGISEIGRRTGHSALTLTLQSSGQAIADAGLTPDDIDGIATLGDTPLADTARALGISPTFRGAKIGPSALFTPLLSAIWAVRNGDARHVLIYRTVNMLGGSYDPSASVTRGDSADAEPGLSWRADLDHLNTDMDHLLAANAFSAANWFALHCQRHMYQYGTTKEQLGWLAVSTREHASRNPSAVYRNPLTLDEYLSARTISDPLGLLDCDVPVDGSVALVVSATSHQADCPHRPVRVAASGGSHSAGGWTQRPDFPKMAMTDAATQMWNATDLKPGDIGVAELYDGFTFLTLSWLEALGLCGEGEAGPFVEGGDRIALSGELPLNTYGGQLSAGRLHGHWLLHEACVQLRGQGGDRQVPGDPEVAVASNGGGPMAGCVLLTR